MNHVHFRVCGVVHSPSDIDLAFDALAKAIVEQAIDDYRRILRHEMPVGVSMRFKNKREKDNYFQAEQRHIERFFLSDELKAYTDIEGQLIIDTLTKEFNEAGNIQPRTWKVKGV